MSEIEIELGAELGCRRLAPSAGGPKTFPLTGDERHHAPDRLADVKHIKIEIKFDIPKGKIFATTTTTLAPINDGLDRMEFDAVELRIKRVDLDGSAASYEYDGGKLRVKLGGRRKAGKEIEIAVEYEATPRRGIYFNRPDDGYPNRHVEIWTQGQDEDSRHWFPCHDFPNEKATSEVIATVPAEMFTVSNGELISVSENRRWNTKTYHWHQDQRHVCYLIALAAGEYSEVKHDVDGVPVSYYVAPGREKDAQRALGNTPDMLRFFTDKIGYAYPWDKYAQITVGEFIFGGMENTGATILTDAALFDARAGLDYSSDPLVAHELAHQWFGDLLTCQEWAHGWLNEGFATYFEALYNEHHLGRDEFHYEMLQNSEIYRSEDADHYRRPLVQQIYNEPIDLFDRHLYEKGSLVLHMLRFVLGEELWWKSINHYVHKHAYGNVVTLDFQRSIAEATGKNLEWFFDQWAFHGGHPDLELSYEWDDASKLARITVVQRQETDDLTPLFRMPLDVDFYDDAGKVTRRRLEMTRKEQTFSFSFARKPKVAVVDPENWVLYAADFEKPAEQWEHILKHCKEIKPRIRAVEGLGKIGSSGAVEAIKRTLLRDRFWGVQVRAARALGKLRGNAAKEALLAGLAVKHPRARRAVVTALGEFKHDAAVADALIAKSRKDESYFVEASAAAAIGKTRSEKASKALEAALKKDSFREVIRAGAFAGYAELHEQSVIPVVLEWTAYGKQPFAREAAVAALGKLGKKDGLVKDEVVDRLSELLHDPSLRLRLRSVTALGKLGERRAVPALRDYTNRELDGRGVRIAREAIVKIQEGKADEETRKLREEVDQLQDENKKLGDRLEKIEARLDGGSSRAGQNGRPRRGG